MIHVPANAGTLLNAPQERLTSKIASVVWRIGAEASKANVSPCASPREG